MKKEVLYTLFYFSIILAISSALSFGLMLLLNSQEKWDITGYVTGGLSVNVSATVAANLSTTVIDFGVGTVNGTECIIDTKAGTTEGCAGFTLPSLTIDNIGNVDLNLSMNITSNRTSFLNSYNGNFSWAVTDTTESGSCQSWPITEGNFYNLTGSPGLELTSICRNFTKGDNNMLDIYFKIVIAPGTKNSTKNTTMTIWPLDANSALYIAEKKLNITLCINELSTLNRTILIDRTINTSELFALDVNCTNETILPVNFSDNMDIFDINSTTGLISFVPGYTTTTSYSVNISLDTGVCPGFEDNALFTLTVNCKNHFPLLVVPDLSFTEDQLSVIDISQYATDTENDTLRYTYQTELSVIPTESDSHLLVYTPSNSEVGTHTMKITAKESNSPPVGCGGTLANSTNITATVTNTNDAPFFPFFETGWTVKYDNIYKANITGRDIDSGDSLRFQTNTSWFNIDTTTRSTLNGNVTVGANLTLGVAYFNKTYAVKVNVTDASGAVNSTDILIGVVEKNFDPVIEAYYPTVNKTKEQGETFDFWVNASDANNRVLTITWYSNGGVENSTAYSLGPYPINNFTYKPPAGRYNITVGVSDGTAAAYAYWNITVNSPPTQPPSGGGGIGGGGGACLEKWGCTDWKPCDPIGIQRRECVDVNKCNTIRSKPSESQTCDYKGSLFASCNDKTKNGDEEGIDCGGKKCKPCPSCSDGIQNHGELGIDCEGPCEQKCKHYTETKALEKCGDGIADPDEIFNCLNDSWSFWVMMPMLFFVVSRIGMLLGVSDFISKKRKRGVTFSVMRKIGVLKVKGK